MSQKNWFEEWFNTKYYHSLYQNRNEAEAKHFISNLVDHLELQKKSFVIDLACGKGRHSITLNELGFEVLGLDLSANSIEIATKSQNNSLKFRVHDMRNPIDSIHADAVFNLFTSVGYFETLDENKKVFKAVHEVLKPNGLFIIDFMNAHKVITNLVSKESKIVDNIEYHITRELKNQHITKTICFEDQEKEYHFEERVQAISLHDFEHLLNTTNFEIIRTFGDFNLNPFDEVNSDRLIVIARKK